LRSGIIGNHIQSERLGSQGPSCSNAPETDQTDGRTADPRQACGLPVLPQRTDVAEIHVAHFPGRLDPPSVLHRHRGLLIQGFRESHLSSAVIATVISEFIVNEIKQGYVSLDGAKLGYEDK
jgi:hypothetical protein